MSPAGITAAGIFVVDRIHTVDRYPAEEGLGEIQATTAGNGGGPWNLLTDLARLGATFPLRAIGLTGDDAEGAFVRAHCRRHGIDVRGLGICRQAPTSTCEVMTSADNGRRTFFHRRGANARLDERHIARALRPGRIFYLGYPLLMDRLDRRVGATTGAALALRAARRRGFTTAVDLVGVAGPLAEVLTPALPWIDHLLLNDSECERLTGICVRRRGRPLPSSLPRVIARLRALGCRGTVVLHQCEGVWAEDAQGRRSVQGRIEVPRTQIAGTNGAGDALAAGYLYAVHEGQDLATALWWGSCAAAASLRSPTASDGVASLRACLALGRRHGALRLDEA